MWIQQRHLVAGILVVMGCSRGPEGGGAADTGRRDFGGDTAASPASVPVNTAPPTDPAQSNTASGARSNASSKQAAPKVDPTPPPAPEPVKTVDTAIPAPVPSTPARILARNTELQLRPVKEYCASDLRRNGTMQFTLVNAASLSDNSRLASGTPATGRIASREPGSETSPDRLSVVLTSIGADSGSSASSAPTLLELRKPSVVGEVVKYGLIGAAAGASVAVILKKDVGKGAAIGGAAGAVAGGIQGQRADPCLVPDQTVLPFRLTRDVEFH